MDDLIALAGWWTRDISSHRVSTLPDRGAPQLAAICNDMADRNRMESFYDEVDLKVTITLEELLRTADPLKRFTLVREIERCVTIFRNTETLKSLTDLAVFAPLIINASFSRPFFFIEGMRQYQRYSAVHDWSHESEKTLISALAVLKATVCLAGTPAVVDSANLDEHVTEDERSIYLRSESLADLISDRPESAMEIIDILRSSPEVSAVLLEEMLGAEQKALRDGLL